MGRTDAEKALEQQRIAEAYQLGLDRGRQKRDGVVVTPAEVVDFQIRTAIEQVAARGRQPHEGVEWLDPFGGTGIYTARLLQIVDLDPAQKAALAANCIVIEIDPAAAQTCADNLAAVYEEEVGHPGSVRVICTDTFELNSDVDLWAPDLPVVRPRRNLVICTSGGGQKVGFTALMTTAIPSLHMADIDGTQCFPLFLYDEVH